MRNGMFLGSRTHRSTRRCRPLLLDCIEHLRALGLGPRIEHVDLHPAAGHLLDVGLRP